jgi:hypothetical protein
MVREFENKVLRKICEPKMKYVTWESRRLDNEDFESYQVKKNKMSGTRRTCGGQERCMQDFGRES